MPILSWLLRDKTNETAVWFAARSLPTRETGKWDSHHVSNPSTLQTTGKSRTLCSPTCPSVTLRRLLTKIYGQGIGTFRSEHLFCLTPLSLNELHSVAHHLLQLGPGLRHTLSDRPMEARRIPVKNSNLIQNSRNGRRVLTGTGFVLTIVTVIQSTGGTKTHRNANDGRGWCRSTGSGDLFCLLWMSPSYGLSSSLLAFALALLVDGSTY